MAVDREGGGAEGQESGSRLPVGPATSHYSRLPSLPAPPQFFLLPATVFALLPSHW